jgi:hypothetical protein
LPDDRRLHQAALAYASDLTLLGATTVPHDVFIGLNVHAASIDHAMWFHRPFRADEWLLLRPNLAVGLSGLGLATARLFQNGTLVSNVAQEGLIRPLARLDRLVADCEREPRSSLPSALGDGVDRSQGAASGVRNKKGDPEGEIRIALWAAGKPL